MTAKQPGANEDEAAGWNVTSERPAQLRAMADEAERGYEVEALLRRRPGGRLPLGSAAASVESVRLDPNSDMPC